MKNGFWEQVLLFSLAATNISAGFRLLRAPCPAEKFRCDELKCIPKQWICDGTSDCNDETDEQLVNCPQSITMKPPTCKSSQFRCNNGYCLPLSWKCDGANDCSDGSDEQKELCHFQCSESEFTCEDGQCIDSTWHCDRHADCSDGSDEVNCTSVDNEGSSMKNFRCEEGFHIPIFWRCDGDADCEDGSDEKNCERIRSGGGAISSMDVYRSDCRDSEFRCPGAFCIMLTWKCDGMDDCPNGEDEIGCKHNTCQANEFRCRDGTGCVKMTVVCDGTNHCLDDSDERGCLPRAQESRADVTLFHNSTTNQTASFPPSDSTKRTSSGNSSVNATAVCDIAINFLCSDGTCIGKNKLCDGKQDCKDTEDESIGICGVNECEMNNGGCAHNCLDKPDGHECTCQKGYKLVGKYTCEDIDECTDIPGSCSQICQNTEGKFRCSCLPGYLRDPADSTRCKASTGETYLLFSHSYDIRRLRLQDRDMISVVSGTRNALALDYHYTDDKILWSDRKENKIYRARLSDSRFREELVSTGEVSADGLGVDWIHYHIYYSDVAKSSINLLSWDTKYRKTLIQENLGRPRAIALAPMDGYIYWTDWGTDAKIERSALDGTKRAALIREPDVEWPNGLTIDPSTNKIYWCDGRLRRISSANLDGTNVKIILFSPTFLRQPFSISVFEDRLYWTDWTKAALFTANKFTGENIHNVSAGHMLESPKVVHVYHQYRQPQGENVCESHSCDHFCVRTITGRPICVCADGFLLDSDGITCVKQEMMTSLKPPLFTNRFKDIDNSPNAVKEFEEDLSNFYQEAKKKSQVGFIIGGCFGVLFTIAAVLAIYFAWSRTRSRPIKRTRFHNPVYRKTTSNNAFEGHGFNFGQDRLFFNPPSQSDLASNEADDAPLTSKDGEIF